MIIYKSWIYVLKPHFKLNAHLVKKVIFDEQNVPCHLKIEGRKKNTNDDFLDNAVQPDE